MPIDPKSLPKDPDILQQMLVDVTMQLDKTQRLLRQLLAAKSGARSEQISADQLALFARELGIDKATTAEPESKDEDRGPDPPAASGEKKPRGRKALPRHLKRERVVHDLAEADKHCSDCQQALRHVGEEISERYEYIPGQMLVIEDACQKYACACKIRTATKPAQPIEKSTASASVLAQVIVSKVCRPFTGAPASENLSPLWSGVVGSDLVRLAAAKRGVVGTAVSGTEAVCVVLQSGWDRRYPGEGIGSSAAAYANGKVLALCR